MLTEYAPGVDVEKDIIGKMEFTMPIRQEARLPKLRIRLKV